MGESLVLEEEHGLRITNDLVSHRSDRSADRLRVLGRNFHGTFLQIGPDDQVEEKLAYPFSSAFAINASNVRRTQFDPRHRPQVLAEDDRTRAERNHENRKQNRRKYDRQCIGKRAQREDRTQRHLELCESDIKIVSRVIHHPTQPAPEVLRGTPRYSRYPRYPKVPEALRRTSNVAGDHSRRCRESRQVLRRVPRVPRGASGCLGGPRGTSGYLGFLGVPRGTSGPRSTSGYLGSSEYLGSSGSSGRR